MQKTPTKIHRAVVFIGLAAAIALCAFNGIHNAKATAGQPSRASPVSVLSIRR